MADHFGSRDECKRFLSQLTSNPLKTNQAPIQPKASISKPHSSQPLFLHRAGLLFSSANQVNVQSAVHSADSLCAQLLLDPLSTDRKTRKLTPEQLQRVTQELVFNGLHNAQQLCKQEGLPLLSVKFQHLEWALAYGSRQEILTALNILESGREPVAAFDKLLFKVLSLLDVGGGDYMQIQAARLLDIGATFAKDVLRQQAVAVWQERQQARRSSQPLSGPIVRHRRGHRPVSHGSEKQSFHRQSLRSARPLAASAEDLSMCHHLETVRTLKELIQKRTASERHRASQAVEKEARQEQASEALAIVSSNLGSKADCRVRIDGTPGLASSLGRGRPVLGTFDWSLPGERALVVKVGEKGGGPSKVEPPGAIVTDAEHALELAGESTTERPVELVARWGREDSPPEVVVRDALRVGRLALAVAYLQKKQGANTSGDRVFAEVRHCGRRLAYAFFRAGNLGTALLALRRLGDSAEQALQELAMGSLQRDIRSRAAAELRSRRHLSKKDARALRILSDLESAYPENLFWRAYRIRLGQASSEDVQKQALDLGLKLAVDDQQNGGDERIVCGEVNGAVLGAWGPFASAGEEHEDASEDSSERAGEEWYLCLAADWVGRWDRSTIERIYLERGVAPPTAISWQAQLQYHVAHHDWSRVEPLLEHVPLDCLKEGVLRVKQRRGAVAGSGDSHITPNAASSVEDLYVPGVKLLLVDIKPLCTALMRGLVEEKLARQHIFLQSDWEGPAPLVALLARANILFAGSDDRSQDGASPGDGDAPDESRQHGGVYKVHEGHGRTVASLVGAHAVVVRHCVEWRLPHLLQAYLDWHDCGRDLEGLEPLQLAAGECEWVHWLLLSRLPGEEYAASFSNARFISEVPISPETPFTSRAPPATLDEMARGGHELRALATLVHAPVPFEECLDTSGETVHLHTDLESSPRIAGASGMKTVQPDAPSWYCNLTSLTQGLEAFPTLCKALEQACGVGSQPLLEHAPGFEGYWEAASLDPVLEPYLRWRQGLFTSAAKDASLLSMLPTSTAPAVRRILHASVLGPETQSTGRQGGAEEERLTEWEDATDGLVKRETAQQGEERARGFSVEHLLRQGRPLAAFDMVLALREDPAERQGLGAETAEPPRSPVPPSSQESRRRAREGRTRPGQNHDLHEDRALSSSRRGDQSDAAADDSSEERRDGGEANLRTPLTDQEFVSILRAAIPLAVRNYDDVHVTSACCAFLELCGVSVTELQVDLVALQRAAEYGSGQGTHERWARSSLAALASRLSDAYLATIDDTNTDVRRVQPPQGTCQPLVDLLARLEEATVNSLAGFGRPTSPEKVRRGRTKVVGKDGTTAGGWLREGEGDSRRTTQQEASERWELVTSFCAIHGLPPSAVYLQQLARDDDWLGYLAEAQKEGTPLDRLTSLARDSFSDPALREHVLIVLRSLGSSWGADSKTEQAHSSAASVENPMALELFDILAEFERAPQPGAALLEKARNLGWPLLAVAAGSYEDADALSCLATWLAATAPDVSKNVRSTGAGALLADTVERAVRKLDSQRKVGKTGETLTESDGRRPWKRRRLDSSEVDQSPDTVEHEDEIHIDGEAVDAIAGSAEEAVVESVARLCGQALFLPLLRGLEVFAPRSSLIHFVRALQSTAHNSRAEAAAHLQRFGQGLLREGTEGGGGSQEWAARAAVAAADAVLGTCPTQFERKLLLEVLAGLDAWGPATADGARYKRLYLAAQLSTPELPLDDRCTDQSLLEALAAVGKWDEARRLAQQVNHADQPPSPQTPEFTSFSQVNPNPLVQSVSREEEPSGRRRMLGGGLLDYVTLLQAEALLAEWRELLWDDPAERLAIWGHCSALFEKHGFPARRAGDFFLHHAEQLRLGDPPAPSLEVHTMLLLAVQWLSGSCSGGPPAASETELAALEAELWMAAIAAQREAEAGPEAGEGAGLIPQQAQGALRATAEVWPAIVSRGGKSKRAGPSGVASNREVGNRARKVSEKEIMEVENTQGSEIVELHKPMLMESRSAADASAAVSALLEDGRLSAARGLLRQLNLTPSNNFQLVQAAEIVAAEGTAALPPQLATFLLEQGLQVQGSNRRRQESMTERADALRQIGELCSANGGRGHILRLAAVCQAAATLSLGYQEAGKTTPLELMQLLALQAGRSGALDAARQMGIAYEGRGELPPRKVARVLAECFQKGLVAAHKGGYLGDGPADEAGPAPLLWKPDDFVQWAAVCREGPQVAHALLRLVIGGKRDLAPPCEVELLLLAHRFYTAAACFDGLDVLAALASNRAAAYLAEDTAAPVVRLLVGTGDWGRLRPLVDGLVQNGHLDLLLSKLASPGSLAASPAPQSAARAALLSALAQQRSGCKDDEAEAAVARVHTALAGLHESARCLEQRAKAGVKRHAAQMESSPTSLGRRPPPQAGSDKELLTAMELYVQAAETWAGVQAGSGAARCAHQASLVAVQLRLPDVRWLDLTPDSARQLFVERPGGFKEALTLAQAYELRDPLEWVPLIWNQVIWRPLTHTERFLHDFASVLPLAQALLMELARAYRAELAARDSDMSRWLPSGAGGAESGRHLAKAFKILLHHVSDYKLRLQLATLATGFADVVDDAIRMLDRVPETAGPLILRKGHGATYVPLM